MFDKPLLLSAAAPISPLDIAIVLTISSLAYFVIFNNFEKHLPAQRRVVKLFIVTGTLAVIGVLFGRTAFWGVISLMTVGQVYLHGWYFPKRGIDGLTAEPHEKYLQVIESMKNRKH